MLILSASTVWTSLMFKERRMSNDEIDLIKRIIDLTEMTATISANAGLLLQQGIDNNEDMVETISNIESNVEILSTISATLECMFPLPE